MAIAITIIAVILGYSTSMYFPNDVPFIKNIEGSIVIKKWISIMLYIIALVLFILEYGNGTGSLIFLFTAILSLCLSILALSFKPKLIYPFGVVALVYLIIDIVHYAS
ncbi:hypothetical protein [Maribacter sp. Asnod1-A12]|uniref:hypothetical protein n=1 Tax=Maribacter sp. Asnod1-A12 TaxID=3160576 RepID=UPI00386B77EB